MNKDAILYDETGAAFSFDHEHDGTAYVRPLVKVFLQSGYGEDIHQEEDFEPARYLVALDRASLSDAPPIAVVDEKLAANRAELEALKAECKAIMRHLSAERSAAEYKLQDAKRQLDQWMKTHRVMVDLGKLLDGQKLYPLGISENHYHHARDIPRIPSMRHASYLTLTSGDFEEGKKWACKQYGSDSYGSPFVFFDTEEERSAVIQSEFEATCAKFRERPDFDTTSYTTTTTLHYGTLLKWVKTHPALSIPADIVAMKAANDADLVEKRKAKLAAELAAIEKAGAA